MKKQITRIISAALAVTMLCGCQANPDKDVVISKNDGAFDAALLETAPTAPDNQTQIQRIQLSNTFTSTDGNVQFALNIDQEVSTASMAVTEVVPHYFTEEEVQRIAGILLPGAEFYERQAELLPKQYSKSQLQELVAQCSQYANEESLKRYFGRMYSEDMNMSLDDEGDNLTAVERYKKAVNYYMELMDTASEEDPRSRSDFTYRLETYYREGPEEAARRSGVGEPRQIQAYAAANGVEYWLCVEKHDGEDYKRSTFVLNLTDSDSPWGINQFVYQYNLMADNEPTQEQVDAAVKKARDLLEQMNIGDWDVDSGKVVQYGEGKTAIHVEAGPVLNGTPTLWQMQSIRVGGNDFDLNYNSTKVTFKFNADGVLVDFRLDSPIEVKTVVNEQPAILSLDEMITRAQDSLSLTDVQSYVHPVYLDVIQSEHDKTPQCRLDITQLHYGLVRVNVKDAPGNYYYVPALILSGSIGLYDPDNGECWLRSGDGIGWLGSEEIMPLVGINALDGSIVPLS